MQNEAKRKTRVPKCRPLGTLFSTKPQFPNPEHFTRLAMQTPTSNMPTPNPTLCFQFSAKYYLPRQIAPLQVCGMV